MGPHNLKNYQSQQFQKEEAMKTKSTSSEIDKHIPYTVYGMRFSIFNMMYHSGMISTQKKKQFS
jgi:hypothetical protein